MVPGGRPQCSADAALTRPHPRGLLYKEEATPDRFINVQTPEPRSSVAKGGFQPLRQARMPRPYSSLLCHQRHGINPDCAADLVVEFE